ncbi:MAG: 4Fe-4S binding protein [Anaerolineales bacterium]|nr:4Fe-4S binding protein [Chloroflexota bacterium]MBL6981069.1 4Fe-4S binding protein [Anaerolineales bacterium]
MKTADEQIHEFIDVFDVWEPARPFLSLMVDEREMDLVVQAYRQDDQNLTVELIADLLGLDYAQADKLVQRAYGRCILNKVVEDGVPKFTPSNFYSRLDHFAKYENWHDIPPNDRKVINRRFLDEFINRHKENIKRKMRGLEAENALPNDTVMLLSEVEEMIHAATNIVVQPCDCRMLGENCDKPVETCIWLDEGAREALDRGHGRSLTKEEAIELLRYTDKKGLMHTADSEWRDRGLHAICNCCACDCYPFSAAQELGTKGVWPKSHYVAAHDLDLCNMCGSCVKRCHFDAFVLTDEIVFVGDKDKQRVIYDSDNCWGCGLCANTCPENAIQMRNL